MEESAGQIDDTVLAFAAPGLDDLGEDVVDGAGACCATAPVQGMQPRLRKRQSTFLDGVLAEAQLALGSTTSV